MSGSLDYAALFDEVNATLEANALYRDFVRSTYSAMKQFNLLLNCADSLIEHHGLDPEMRLQVAGMLLAIMGVRV